MSSATTCTDQAERATAPAVQPDSGRDPACVAPPAALLNLGCGQRYHAAWTNVDVVPRGSDVIGCDLRGGIPFPSGHFDAVYHSHLLEHMPKDAADPFLKECHRVLRPGGFIRVAVPDLEQIAKLYLEAVDKAAGGDAEWHHHHEWIMLELFDQTVRERSGGEMAAYLQRPDLPNEVFVVTRIGEEGRRTIADARRHRQSTRSNVPRKAPRAGRLRRLVRFVLDADFRRDTLIRRLLGSDVELLELGRFRRGGQIHQWMYDRFSLATALQAAGFSDPQRVQADQSAISGFAAFELDTDEKGVARKPDSLYMEAVKR